jgi:hypothetical protein
MPAGMSLLPGVEERWDVHGLVMLQQFHIVRLPTTAVWCGVWDGHACHHL